MTNKASGICRSEDRRHDVRHRGYNGIDYIEVSDDQLTLTVHLLREAPESISAQNVLIEGGVRVQNIKVLSVDLFGDDEDENAETYIQVTVNQPGDFSTYTVRLVEVDDFGTPTGRPLAGFDLRYAQLDFSFKAGCPSDLDCVSNKVCPPPEFPAPEINYLAKDYSSFRQLIFDRLALTTPAWQEQHVPDVGVALVEILAYVADYLSYYQDAVATEAYLGTARQRISVRRHVRLVDYRMHEGCNARAWVSVATDNDVINPPLEAGKVYFLTESSEGASSGGQEVFAPVSTTPISLYSAHSLIHFYSWGNRLCCLPKGTTTATLWDQAVTQQDQASQPAKKPKHKSAESTEQNSTNRGGEQNNATPVPQPRMLHLQPGDILVFEEVIGPGTNNAADVDPSRRHAVQLTKVQPSVDPLYGTQILEIEWAQADALPFELCLSIVGQPTACDYVPDVSLARGNVVLVDNGMLVADEYLGKVPAGEVVEKCKGIQHPVERTVAPGDFRPTLQNTRLSFSQRFSHCKSALQALLQNPRKATPSIQLISIPPLPDGSDPLFDFADLNDQTTLALRLAKAHDQSKAQDDGAMILRGQLSDKLRHSLDQYAASIPPQKLPDDLAKGLGAELQQLVRHWTPQPDLIESQSDDRHYVVEMDDDGYAHLRFGDGDLGCSPEPGEAFSATYRVGNGSEGNVGAGSINRIQLVNQTLSGASLQPTNPVAAQGGTEPELIEEVRMFAPGAFRKQLERAITADDYALLAESNPQVQRAAATLRWTGCRYEVRVAIDPFGTEQVDTQLLERIQGHLHPYRRVGHDVIVVPAQYVPIRLGLKICVLQDYLQGHVEAALLDVFSDQVLADGKRGFFHPDNLTFGTDIYLSQIVASAQAVTGVESVVVTKLERFFEGPNAELESGLLPIGPLAVARLDNDPSFPENGVLSLDMRGGR